MTRVRALDVNGDMQFGRGTRDFLINDPRGVGQVVRTRLGMQLGQYFLDVTDGTPYRTQVLGFRTDFTRDPALRARILGTNGVTGIDTYASQLARKTRAYSVQCVVSTRYGKSIVSASSSAPNQDVGIAR